MQSLHTFRIRDNRRKSYFTVDNIFLEDYASVLGSIASMIYIYLCKCADNKTQESFPSQQTIAEKIGTTRKTVSEKIAILESCNLVTITNVFDENNGSKLNNVYTLLDQSEWIVPHVTSGDIPHVTSGDMAQAHPHVTSGDINNNTHNINKTNNIDLDNPTPKQRKAIKGTRKVGWKPKQQDSIKESSYKEKKRGIINYGDIL